MEQDDRTQTKQTTGKESNDRMERTDKWKERITGWKGLNNSDGTGNRTGNDIRNSNGNQHDRMERMTANNRKKLE